MHVAIDVALSSFEPSEIEVLYIVRIRGGMKPRSDDFIFPDFTLNSVNCTTQYISTVEFRSVLLSAYYLCQLSATMLYSMIHAVIRLCPAQRPATSC